MKREAINDFRNKPVQVIVTSTMKRAYQVALLCWAAPLVAGTVIFWLWLRTDPSSALSARLALYGLYNICFGVGCVFVGVFALAIYFCKGSSAGVPHSRLWRHTLVMHALLFSNFAVANVMIACAAEHESGNRIVTVEPLHSGAAPGSGEN
jgi:hypothetical protein